MNTFKQIPVVLTGLAAAALNAAAQSPVNVEQQLQRVLDSARTAARWPGATLAVALADGRVLAVASGMSDTARKVPMRTNDRLLQGSVGKTYVAAVALQLVAEGTLDLDAPISRYLGTESWFSRLPNAQDITVRQLMNHTSGLVRYEFQPAVAAVLTADPYKLWTPAERLGFILDTKPPFAAGQGWEYSDTNYIVLGMIIERIAGRAYYDEMRERILVPLRLENTIPSDRPELPGVVVGYAGPNNELGGYDASIVNGRFAANPQFEWTGGGVASTTADLARWAKLLYEAKAFPQAQLEQMLNGVPARLGPNTRYGLAVILRDTPLGAAQGHSGFFPGYATEMMYFPSLRVSAALQVNTSNPYPRGMPALLVRSARIATDRPERRLNVEIFAPGVITTGAYELTTAFSRDGNTALWSVSTPTYGRWLGILESTRSNGRWSEPYVPSFSGRWIDADPMFTEDGSRVFFLSRRPLSGETPERGYRLWYVDRRGSGWGDPVALPPAVNTSDMHYVSPVRSGALYIASVRPDSRNQADVYRVPFANSAWSEPENVGPTVNSADHWDTTPYVAPDESWMIFASRGRSGSIGDLDLYISLRENGAWTTPLLLPASINDRTRDFCPIASPDGQWLYFTSERGSFDAQRSERVKHSNLRKALSDPGNGLGDIYRTSLPELLAWARANRR